MSRRERRFFVLVGILSSTILLKIGPIQVLELIYLVVIAWYLFQVIVRNQPVRLYRPFARLGLLYVIVCLAAIALGITSLRFDFFIPEEVSQLKYPVWATVSRVVELAASAAVMVYLASAFRQTPDKAKFLMLVYFWTGIASTIYSYVTYPLDVLGVASLGVYSSAHRFRGFYNEGGPYGLYLLSVFVVGYALQQLGCISKGLMRWMYVLLFLTLILSFSKAAILAGSVLLLINALSIRSGVQRLLILAAGALLVIVGLQYVSLDNAVRTYQRSSAAYERLSHLHPKDPSFVLGRVAGAFIVPRMIAAHPLTGIGWGNYGILRNAPEYRGASAWAPAADDPGLGILGTAAELGLPLTALLCWCLSRPFAVARRGPDYLRNLALLQPLVTVFGAQLNLTYPWIVSAFALGLSAAHFHNSSGRFLASGKDASS